jgi:mono/diheme cytochrome c family protein
MKLGTLVIAVSALVGCSGQPATKPPVRIIRDMYDQPKLLPESEARSFGDGASMRPFLDGTVAQEDPLGDEAIQQGRGVRGYVESIPVTVDEALISRGQERFNVFCVPCHDRAGSGHGTVTSRGFPVSVDLSSDHTRGLKDGELFNIVKYGVRTMPGHRHQIPVSDRWAIVAWVRVLEQSQHATVADLGGEMPDTIEPEATP